MDDNDLTAKDILIVLVAAALAGIYVLRWPIIALAALATLVKIFA